MKIGIDLTALYGRTRTGVELYSIDLYRALLKTKNDIYPIFHGKNELDSNPNAYIIPKCPRLYLENVALSLAVRKIKTDIVIFPCFPPPVDLRFGCKAKIFKVLHDLVYFDYRNTLPIAAKYYYTPKLKLGLSFYEGLITISETTKADIYKYYHGRVFNCGENIAEEYKFIGNKTDEKYLSEFDISPNKYFISSSTIEPRKNIKYLLKIIKPVLIKTGMKLVLVGKVRTIKDKQLRCLLDEMKDMIVFTKYVSLECLASLYKYSYAFILMSIYEGFGRTPFEAVACGCKKIILSDIPIFRETFNGNATFLPLNDPEYCKSILLEKNYIEVDTNIDVPFNVLESRINDIFLEKINC